jgi:hypothetical protein
VSQVLFFRSVRRLLVTANVVHTSSILVTLIMEAIRSYETSVLIRAVRRDIPEDAILQFIELFSIYLIFQRLYSTADYSAVNKNEYQNRVLRVKHGCRMRPTI